MILIAPTKSAARIEVGYGLEGSIPDARASAYLQDFLPALKSSAAAARLSRLLDKIENVLAMGQVEQKPKSGENELDAHPEWKWPFVLVVFSLFTLFAAVLRTLGRFHQRASACDHVWLCGLGLWGVAHGRLYCCGDSVPATVVMEPE